MVDAAPLLLARMLGIPQSTLTQKQTLTQQINTTHVAHTTYYDPTDTHYATQLKVEASCT
jgi:hypothetical protein